MSQPGVSVARLPPSQFTFPGPKSTSESPEFKPVAGRPIPSPRASTSPPDGAKSTTTTPSAATTSVAAVVAAAVATPREPRTPSPTSPGWTQQQVSQPGQDRDRGRRHSPAAHMSQDPSQPGREPPLPPPSDSEEGSGGPGSQPGPTAPGAGAAASSGSDPLLSSLLGAPVASWTYSNDALVQALNLRAEQERTKQEYYRLELRKRSLDMLNEAIRANVPPQAIAALFASSQEYEHATSDRDRQHSLSSVTSIPPSAPPSASASLNQPSPAALAGAFAANVPSLMKPTPTSASAAVASGSKLNLGPDRERYPFPAYQGGPPASSRPSFIQQAHHHQRNLSLPPQSALDLQAAMAAKKGAHPVAGPIATQPLVGPQLQPAATGAAPAPGQGPGPAPGPSGHSGPGPSRGHHHHASMSAIPSQGFSPVRSQPHVGSPTAFSSPSQPGPSARPWQAGNQPMFSAPPPSQPTTIPPSSPSSSLQVYQFHHYQPNVSGGTGGGSGPGSGPGAGSAGGGLSAAGPRQATSPRKEPQFEEGGSALKRQKSVSDRASSPVPSRPSGASAAASAHASASSRRRGLGHSRHRSEASILRGGPGGWTASLSTPPPIQTQAPPAQGPPGPSGPQGPPGAPSRAPVAVSTPPAQTVQIAQAQGPGTTGQSESGVNMLANVAAQAESEERSKKHGVNYIIDDKE